MMTEDRNAAAGNAPAAAPRLTPLPHDPRLPSLDALLDGTILDAVLSDDDRQHPPPVLNHLAYRPGSRAIAGYVAQRSWHGIEHEERFGAVLRRGHDAQAFRYPDDPELPGLAAASSGIEATSLISEHVNVHPRNLRVELVRYRPGSRSVLRYILGWRASQIGELELYGRAVRPKRLPRLLRAAEFARATRFVVPSVVGVWEQGAVAWLTGAPGETVRSLIRAGTAPDPHALFDAMEPLWSAPPPENIGPPPVGAAFQQAELLMTTILVGHDGGLAVRVADALRRWTEAWRPTSAAHNDFYDDQIVLTPAGKLALVDFEEAGAGDARLDVANMLAHLRWMAAFGSAASGAYAAIVRRAALERFAWSNDDLAQPEGYALFRLAGNPLMQAQPNWPEKTNAGLRLAAESLGV